MFLRDAGREGTTLPKPCLPAHDIAPDYLFKCGGCVLAELESRCVDQRLGLTRRNRTVALIPLSAVGVDRQPLCSPQRRQANTPDIRCQVEYRGFANLHATMRKHVVGQGARLPVCGRS